MPTDKFTTVLTSDGNVGKYGTTFVDFSVELFSGIVEAMVKSGMDQMQAYAELVSALTSGLQNYTLQMSGIDPDKPFSHSDNQPHLDSYIADVLGLTGTTGSHSLSSTEVTNLTAHFEGVEISGGDFTTILNGTSNISHANLQEFVFEKLVLNAKTNYDILIVLVREGWIKVIANKWLVETELDIQLSSQETDLNTASTYDSNARGWSVGGYASGSFRRWGFGIRGGYSSRKLTVSTSNSVSTGEIESEVNFKGRIKIEGTTATYAPRDISPS